MSQRSADRDLTSWRGRILRGATEPHLEGHGGTSSGLRFVLIRAGERLVREIFTHALIAVDGAEWAIHLRWQKDPIRIAAPVADDYPSLGTLVTHRSPYRAASRMAAERLFIDEVIPRQFALDIGKMREIAGAENRAELASEETSRVVSYLRLLNESNRTVRFKTDWVDGQSRSSQWLLARANASGYALYWHLRVKDFEEAKNFLTRLEKKLTAYEGPIRVPAESDENPTFLLTRSHLSAQIIADPSGRERAPLLPDEEGKLGLVIYPPAHALSAGNLNFRDDHTLIAWRRLIEMGILRGQVETFERSVLR